MPAEVEPEIEIIEKNEAGIIEKMSVKSPYTGYTIYYYVKVHGEVARSFSSEKAARKYLYGRTANVRQRNQATYAR